jgi:hypothetical protein
MTIVAFYSTSEEYSSLSDSSSDDGSHENG